VDRSPDAHAQRWTIPVAAESLADCHEAARYADLAAENGGHIPPALEELAAQLTAEARRASAHAHLLARLTPAQRERITTQMARLCGGLLRHGYPREEASPEQP